VSPTLVPDVVDVDVEMAPHQVDFVADMTSTVVVLEGGLGCGKTFSAMLKVLAYADAYPGIPGVVVEPTNDLIGTIFLATVDEFLPLMGIAYEFRRTWRGRPNVLLLHPDTSRETAVYLRSGDRPERIVGFKVGWALLDEADQMDADVYRRVKGRLRDARVPKLGGTLQTCLVYTPEPGFNWTWSAFHERRTTSMHVIEGVATSANTWNPTGYVEGLLEVHDGDDAARVTTGKRSAREGLVYRRFSDINLGTHPDPWGGDCELWCDFNATKMAWCWVSLQGGRAYVFDEIVREDTDTLEHAELAARIAAEHMSAREMGLTVDEVRARPESMWAVTPKMAAQRVTVVGDAAGEYDKGAGAKTSYELIRQVGFQTRTRASNPDVEDTVLTVNVALADGWLVFDASRAKYTTMCVRQQPRGKDGSPLKGFGSREKVKAGLDHGSDCVRYGTWLHRPVQRRRGNQTR
jgi:hypothetical protein